MTSTPPGKRALGRSQLDAILESAGLDPRAVRACEQLPFGTYNTVYRLDLAGRDPLLLKIPPDPGVPAMSYEKGLLLGEATMFRAAAERSDVPVPEVVAIDPGDTVIAGGYLLMTHCPGVSWDRVGDLDGADRARLRRELGGLVAALHAVTGPAYGYPSASIAPAPDWRGTFTAMVEALLEDARRFRVRLPVARERIRALVAAAGPALAEADVPALVHFDLWEGNILVEGAGSAARISALIDGERMFWGDPLADFASLTLFSCATPTGEPALIEGYRARGGLSRRPTASVAPTAPVISVTSTGPAKRAESPDAVPFSTSALTRMALYRAYLYLIMLIETVPRSLPPAEAAARRHLVAPLLVAALDTVAAQAD